MLAKKVLMVEGKDDEHVVKHICGSRGLGRIDQVADYGGIEPLIDGIEVRLKESDISVVGLIVDADADVAARWASIRERLVRAGYPTVPIVPPGEGLVLEAPEATLLPKVGVWIMPDNQVSGVLEDFLCFLVPQEDQLFQYVSSKLDALDPGLRRFALVKKPKVLVHSWLAYQEEPGRPLGQAVSARYLDPGLPAADMFARWLERVFFTPRATAA